MAVFGLAVACVGATAAAPSEVVNVPLAAAPQNAGKVAVATMVPTGESSTEVVVFVSGLPSQVSYPARLYTYIYPGTCGNLESKPAFDLNKRVKLGELVPSRMWKTVPVSMTELRSSQYAIVLRTSPADGFVNVFCGNITRAG